MDNSCLTIDELSDALNQGIFSSMKAHAEEFGVPIMQDESLLFLIDWIRKNQLKRVLEIGSAIGYSSIAMATFTKAFVITIEKDMDRLAVLKQNVLTSKLKEHITIIEGDALEVEIPSTEPIDLLFIDAAKAQYQKFFIKYAPLVRQGGWIVSDNLLFRGQVEDPSTIISRNRRQLVGKIRRYQEWLKELPDYETQVIDVGDGISLTHKR